MANKHQIQRDFYKRQKEWKEALRVEENKLKTYNNTKKVEVLFDEELYPEFKNTKDNKTYFREIKDLEPDKSLEER